MQCTAKSKRSGQQCKSSAVLGTTKCAMHGGKSLKGIASATFKTGRYSKFLPTRMQERYQESINDNDLLELRTSVALVDARLEDLIRRVDTGESGQAWGEARKTLAVLREAMSSGDVPLANAAMKELDRIIARGLSDYAAWSEIGNSLEQRRKLVESERKRLVEMQQFISHERALLLIGSITEIIRHNVTDRQVLNAISLDLVRLMSRPENETEILNA